MAGQGQSFEDAVQRDVERLLWQHWRRLLLLVQRCVDQQLPEGGDPLDDGEAGDSEDGSS